MPFSKPWHSQLHQITANFSLVVTTFDILYMEFQAFQQTLTQATSESSNKLQPAMKSCNF
jgi:hypothetical protein